MEFFIKKYNVSRETYQMLECYVVLLHEWQTKFNLVSKNSLAEVWTRHIEDSAQLFKYIGNDVHLIYDLGSGAGFPALVLAIMAKELRPDIRFKLVESITKKTLYLNAVKQDLGLDNVEIINARAENINLKPADMITSRAMANLNALLGYSSKFCVRNTQLLFPKGRSYQAEIDEAKKNWNFKLKVLPNDVSDDGVILLLDNLRRKK